MPAYHIIAQRGRSLICGGYARDDAHRAQIFANILHTHPGCLIKAEPTTMTDPASAEDDLPLVVTDPVHHNRRQRIARVTIPAEIHALAELTGKTPDDLIADMLAAHVSAIRSRAKSLTSTAGI
jgi:hypothetical protein